MIILNKKKEIAFIQPNKNYKIDLNLTINKGIFYKKYKGMAFCNQKFINLKLLSNEDEIIIGCDNLFFWYKSTYDNNVLYYGSIEEVSFIIKEIFNPKIIINTLLPKHTTNKTLIGNYNKLLKNELVFDNGKIKEQRVYDENNLLYLVKYNEYKGDLALYIKIFYPKEDTWVFIKINEIILINTHNYTIPDDNKKVKLSP